MKKLPVWLGMFLWLSSAVVSPLFAFNTDESATLVLGQANMTGNSPNQGTGYSGSNSEHGPQQLWTDATHLFLADTLNNRILGLPLPATSDENAVTHLGSTGGWSESNPNYPALGAPTLYQPNSVWFDSSSTTMRLIVADTYNHRVLIYNQSLPVANGAPANVVIGQPDMASNSPNAGNTLPGPQTLNFPAGVFSDGNRLLIADSGNNRVLIFNTIPTTNYAPASLVIGQGDFSGHATTISQSSLNQPTSVMASGGALVIADTGNNRVLIFNSVPTASTPNADLVIGQAGWTQNQPNRGGSASAISLSGPRCAFLNYGRLFIADTQNHRVLIFNSLPASADVPASQVLGQADFTSNGPNQNNTVSAKTLSSPGGLFFSSSLLWVADSGNNRTLGYPDEAAFTPTATSTLAITSTPTVMPSKTPTAMQSPTSIPVTALTATPSPNATPLSGSTFTQTSTAATDNNPNTPLKRFFPNPVKRGGKMTLDFVWPESGRAQTDLFNFSGQHVSKILDENVNAGPRPQTWTLANDAGKSLTPGVYWLVIQINSRRQTAKIVIIP